MSKFTLSSYSETDSYDSKCDHLHHKLTSNFFSRKSLPRYEFKIEISELLAKFAEYSSLGALFSCKYINHPITSGLLLYIPYHKITKYRDGSLIIGSESDWETYDSTNEDSNSQKLIQDRVEKAISAKAIYFQRGKSKNDVSYARMVKKPHVPNSLRYKEEMWGRRYPNKRYVMNNSIQNNIQKILLVISNKCANEFSENDFNTAMKSELCKKIQVQLQCIRQNLQRNQYESFQQVLDEFGKLFQSSRLITSNYPHLLNKISQLEIEFEKQLEIHFGEWNRK